MKTKVTGLGDIGVIMDRDAHDIPMNAWSTLQNVRAKNGYISPVDGRSDITDTGDIPNPNSQAVYLHQLVGIEVDSVFYWVFPYDSDGDGDANKIYYWDGGVAGNITRQISAADVDYTGTASNLWQVTQFNGLVVLNNGVDAPQYWDGNTSNKCTFLPYDGSTTWNACDGSETEFDTNGSASTNDYKAKVIRAFQNTLIAMDITEDTTNYPQMIHWSHPADPGGVPTSWDYADATNDAGRFVLAETDGKAVDGLTLGDVFVVYKEDAIYYLSYIGGTFIYQRDAITTSHGLWSTNCVVDIGNVHVCLGNGTVYTHSGGSPKNILEGRNADALFSSIDETNYQKAFLTHNRSDSEVWICYPESGYSWANKALVWNYHDNTWHYRDIPQCSTIKPGIVAITTNPTWNDVSGTWAAGADAPWLQREYSPIGDTLVAAAKQLTRFGVGNTADGVVASRKGMIIGNADEWNEVTRYVAYASGDPFTVRIGTQDSIGGAVTWSDPQTWTPGTTKKLDFRQNGLVHARRITGTGNWKISGEMFEFKSTGEE